MTIEDFIYARIREDEEWAQVCQAAHENAADNLVLFIRRWLPAGFGKKYPDPHPLPGEPARVLAECAAWRAVIESIRARIVQGWGYHDIEHLVEADLSPIAAIWSKHRDYQQKWAA